MRYEMFRSKCCGIVRMKNMLKNYFVTFLTKIYIRKLLTLKERLVLNEIMSLFVHSLLKYKKYYSLGKLHWPQSQLQVWCSKATTKELILCSFHLS